MKIFCPLGCEKILSYSNLQNHLDSCENLEKEYKCELCFKCFSFSYEENKKEEFKFQLENHKFLCENVEIFCEFCNKKMLKKEYDVHLLICDYKILECEKCGIDYPLRFKTAHDEFYCKEIGKFKEGVRDVFN